MPGENCPPTDVLLVPKMKFIAKTVCPVIKEIAMAFWFGTKKSQVQILPPRRPPRPAKMVAAAEFESATSAV
jgi:hypothetical protein